MTLTKCYDTQGRETLFFNKGDNKLILQNNILVRIPNEDICNITYIDIREIFNILPLGSTINLYPRVTLKPSSKLSLIKCGFVYKLAYNRKLVSNHWGEYVCISVKKLRQFNNAKIIYLNFRYKSIDANTKLTIF